MGDLVCDECGKADELTSRVVCKTCDANIDRLRARVAELERVFSSYKNAWPSETETIWRAAMSETVTIPGPLFTFAMGGWRDDDAMELIRRWWSDDMDDRLWELLEGGDVKTS